MTGVSAGNAWRPGVMGPTGPVVDTFAAETGYSPLQDPDQGDLQAAERSLIESALQNTGGNRRRAAERLGISERTLYRKLRLYGLS